MEYVYGSTLEVVGKILLVMCEAGGREWYWDSFLA